MLAHPVVDRPQVDERGGLSRIELRDPREVLDGFGVVLRKKEGSGQSFVRVDAAGALKIILHGVVNKKDGTGQLHRHQGNQYRWIAYGRV